MSATQTTAPTSARAAEYLKHPPALRKSRTVRLHVNSRRRGGEQNAGSSPDDEHEDRASPRRPLDQLVAGCFAHSVCRARQLLLQWSHRAVNLRTWGEGTSQHRTPRVLPMDVPHPAFGNIELQQLERLGAESTGIEGRDAYGSLNQQTTGVQFTKIRPPPPLPLGCERKRPDDLRPGHEDPLAFPPSSIVQVT